MQLSKESHGRLRSEMPVGIRQQTRHGSELKGGIRDGNGRSPFQVSVGVVRLRRWWLVAQEDYSFSLSSCAVG